MHTTQTDPAEADAVGTDGLAGLDRLPGSGHGRSHGAPAGAR
jgi:hypothetical protein